MWNWVSSSRLIQTPTAMGTMWMASSRTSAGIRSRYGRRERLDLRRLGPCGRAPDSCAGSAGRAGPAAVVVTIAVLSTCGRGGALRRPATAALPRTNSVHLLLRLGQLGSDRIVGERLTTRHVGEQLLHRGTDQGLELALRGHLGSGRGLGVSRL